MLISCGIRLPIDAKKGTRTSASLYKKPVIITYVYFNVPV